MLRQRFVPFSKTSFLLQFIMLTLLYQVDELTGVIAELRRRSYSLFPLVPNRPNPTKQPLIKIFSRPLSLATHYSVNNRRRLNRFFVFVIQVGRKKGGERRELEDREGDVDLGGWREMVWVFSLEMDLKRGETLDIFTSTNHTSLFGELEA